MKQILFIIITILSLIEVQGQSKRTDDLIQPTKLARALTDTHRLDSIVSPTRKEVFSYSTENDNVVSEVSTWIDTSDTWLLSTQRTWEYSDGLYSSYILSFWYPQAKTWYYSQKLQYLYSNAILESTVQSNWTNTWVEDLKTDYHHNIDGEISSSETTLWDLNSSEWSKLSKNEYSYDSKGNNISKLSYRWRSSEWKIDGSTMLEYDNGGKIMRQVTNIINGVFTMPVYEIEYSYDNNDNIYTKTW